MIRGGDHYNYYTEIYDFNQAKVFENLTWKILDFEDYNYGGNLIITFQRRKFLG